MLPILDDALARLHQDDLLQEAEHDRLTIPFRTGPSWHRRMRRQAGRILVAVGTALTQTQTAAPGVNPAPDFGPVKLTPERVDG